LVATLLGLAVGALALLPRISVSPPSSQVDPNNVLSVSFDISNTGYIPLEDVSAKLAAGDIGAPNAPGIHAKRKPNGAPEFWVYFPIIQNQHHYLGLDERFTINPESQMGGFVSQADIAVIVSYQPWFIPWRREKSFRFFAKPDRQGKVYWRSWPIDEIAPDQ
jgi:hypothetical protein